MRDRVDVQRVKNSIAEGQNLLRAGIDVLGRPLTPEKRFMIRKSVENAKKKIGESIMPEKGYTIEDVTPEGYAPAEQI